MNSMTGFGRATAVGQGGRRFVVEIRSVNHRGVDLKVRGRDVEAACEVEILRAVRARIERGSVVVSVREDSAPGTVVDIERLRAAHAALEAARAQLGISAEVDLMTIAAFLGDPGGGVAAGGGAWVGAAHGGAGGVADWATLRPAVLEALDGLQAMRVAEGRALGDDLRARLARLRATVAAIGEGAAGLPTRAARRLEERLALLAGAAGVAAVEPARLAQEVALLAERLDVSEELVRLGAHADHLERLLGGSGSGSEGGSTGRRIDFVVQEIGRELNTVGAKVQDAGLATLVIEGKAELEKIREQAQNIE